MEPTVLIQILTKHAHCKKDGQKHLVPEDVSLTLYVSTGEENLVVDRITEVMFEGDVVVCRAAKESMFAFIAKDVRAVRMTGDSGGFGYKTR
jgi:hypothetical protein